jgi:[acyl-carrier-protein] S-malonyltransferase
VNQAHLAFVFPGQGSQALGMLGELAMAHGEVRAAFDEASSGAGVDLWALSQQGPEEQLNQTEFTQPALLAAGVAAWRAWVARGGAQPAQFAGHSLGEYAALVVAGALSLADGARLVRERGRLMQAAVPAGSGAMAAVLGADDALVAEVCVQVSNETVVVPANYNSPGQIVIGGHAEALDRALAELASRGVKKAVKLAVSVPSHTPLMRGAATQLGEFMQTLAWKAPRSPRHSERGCSRASVGRGDPRCTGAPVVLAGALDGMRAGTGRRRRDAPGGMRSGQGTQRSGQAHRQVPGRAQPGHAGGLRRHARGLSRSYGNLQE